MRRVVQCVFASRKKRRKVRGNGEQCLIRESAIKDLDANETHSIRTTQRERCKSPSEATTRDDFERSSRQGDANDCRHKSKHGRYARSGNNNKLVQ